MKNSLFYIFSLAFVLLIACEPTASEDADAGPDYETFATNLSSVQAFIQGHADEDIEAQLDLLSDTLKFSPPAYNGGELLGKEDLRAVLQGYHDNFENISFVPGVGLGGANNNGFFGGSVYPEETANSAPNVIRIYGTWSATHSESGQDIHVKWYGLMIFNSDGKVASFSDWYDVNGIAVQLSEASATE